ncbi:ArnT family glycosyltransferase [Hydrogenophaga pseudoflava]|uniref:ArnT family glycosyltransferase n=1 Tax=Hydrogenophaga pseudoflava TaxID=47421 RepID=UPI0027E5BD4B|nr:glycosyltransferase family 39 protein [Hydrogenophaga pseudoflava]MDQ7744012.1 glycosyltransferase family 39 protein [Hydrogenophaga pseudoflava]
MNNRPTDAGPEELRWTRSLWFVIALALSLRLIWAWWVPVIPSSDGEAYDAFARTLVQHGTFGWEPDHPTSFWPPGTTFLHASMFALFGIRYEPIVAMNIALSLGIVVVTARLAARFWGQTVAVLSALVLAVWPTLVMYPTILASELPFLFLTLLALDLWTFPRLGLTARALLAGLVLGFAALVRPQALLLPLVYAGGLVLMHRAGRTAWLEQIRCVVLAGIAMAVVVAPWTWRNHQLYDEPMLISSNGGITLWMGNTPGTDGRYMSTPKKYSHLSENERAKVLGQEARAYILQDPVAFAARAVKKLVILYANESVGVGWNSPGIRQVFGETWEQRLKRLTQATWALICLLVAVGLWSSLRRVGFLATLFSPVTLSILYFTAIHMVVVSQERYHLAFAGQWAMLAGLGLAQLAAWRPGAAPAPRQSLQ